MDKSTILVKSFLICLWMNLEGEPPKPGSESGGHARATAPPMVQKRDFHAYGLIYIMWTVWWKVFTHVSNLCYMMWFSLKAVRKVPECNPITLTLPSPHHTSSHAHLGHLDRCLAKIGIDFNDLTSDDMQRIYQDGEEVNIVHGGGLRRGEELNWGYEN